MATNPDKLFKAKLDRTVLADLSVVEVEPGANSPASITIPAPGVDWIIVPMHFRLFAQVPGYFGLTSLLQQPCREDMAERHGLIGRTDDQGAQINNIITPLNSTTEYEKNLDIEVEVGGLTAFQSLQNTGLTVTFDGIRADERQYILLNYKTIMAKEVI